MGEAGPGGEIMETFGVAHDRYLEPLDNPACDKCPCEDKNIVWLDCWNAGVCTCHPRTARIVTAIAGAR